MSGSVWMAIELQFLIWHSASASVLLMHHCNNLISGWSARPDRKSVRPQFGRILENWGRLLPLLWLVHFPPCLHSDVVDLVWKTNPVGHRDNACNVTNTCDNVCRDLQSWQFLKLDHVRSFLMPLKSQTPATQNHELTKYPIECHFRLFLDPNNHFLPTAWDVFGDLKIALHLKDSAEVASAGSSYLFICFFLESTFRWTSSSETVHELRYQSSRLCLCCLQDNLLIFSSLDQGPSFE